jgi:hypothetical protein
MKIRNFWEIYHKNMGEFIYKEVLWENSHAKWRYA